MDGDSVLELQQYKLRGGQRETLISLFENEFVTPPNEAGCFVRGTFRDLDDHDRFEWIRGFGDMLSRKPALESCGWRHSVPESVIPALMRKPEILRLAPTDGSELS